ncbi:Nucleoplasmin [Labeo rohita]|uniref:Nucleoplasmin n=1 Tax=Labeo rohita TaxID=84645 RepID=A0ABQ8MGK2_LABRO|nr:Nucleoplasmin [Labeo rohita]
MTGCFLEIDSVASISPSESSSSSSVSDRACVYWGCVLSASETTAICLSEEAGDEMHMVAVCDGVGASKPLPIATLRHCMPMISFPGLELIPPVTFKLCSGKGPVYISAQHITCKSLH